jgi:hypothetical protein
LEMPMEMFPPSSRIQDPLQVESMDDARVTQPGTQSARQQAGRTITEM